MQISTINNTVFVQKLSTVKKKVELPEKILKRSNIITIIFFCTNTVISFFYLCYGVSFKSNGSAQKKKKKKPMIRSVHLSGFEKKEGVFLIEY